MTPDDLVKINQNIAATIKTTVNGKIDGMRTQLNEYIRDDNEWKADVKPYIELMRQTKNFSDGLIFILKFIGLFGGAGGIIYAGIKFIEHFH